VDEQVDAGVLVLPDEVVRLGHRTDKGVRRSAGGQPLALRLAAAASRVRSRGGPRMELYKKIQRMLVESGAGFGLVDQVTGVATRKEVQGFGFNVVMFPVLYDVSLTT
jgi:hypothetical protein